MKTIRIGNGAGFWGDNLDAPRILAENGSLDYLTLEYLAELTMSILAHQKSRNAEAGYVTDFPPLVKKLVPVFQQSPGFRIVTNAGGMNPFVCAKKVAAALKEAGLDEIKVATVSGDDVFANLDEHLQAGVEFRNMETGEPLGAMKEKVTSANAYLGAEGIVQALSTGARIVVTGRVADVSLTVGPCMFEFGWSSQDWNKLATATVAGHLIECGAQMTGGMFSDWTEEISLADVGYPIAEIGEDGSVVLTKAEGSGGTVTPETVAEQLVYEIGDPAHYLTPDVDADFSQVQLEQVEEDRVAMTNARGNPAPVEYKVSMSYADGYMYSGTLTIVGRNAETKARACAKIIFARLKRAGIELDRTNVDCLGAGDSLPGVWPFTPNLYEVVLRISAHHSEKEPLERLSRELAPLVTSGPPGVTGYTGARSKPHRVLAYWPTTIPRERAVPEVQVQTAGEWLT